MDPMIEARAKIALHQVDEYVWCDAHSEVHQREANVYKEDQSDLGLGERCEGSNWRPVFTTDSLLGQY